MDSLQVEPHKRARLLGVGGINLKKILLETGVQVMYPHNLILISNILNTDF